MMFAERYGPWAVIAGASEGTGRAFALELARRGIGCVLVARRAAPLQALAAELDALGGAGSVVCVADLAGQDAKDRIVAAVGLREVGLFVSNAGADPHAAEFLDETADAWISLVNRNVLTTMRCCHHFGGEMRARGRGGIVLVGSGACYGGGNRMAVYSGSKAFDLCFGEGLWAELRPHGVDVLNLVLGRTDTPALRALLSRKGLPLPEGLAAAEEVARLGLERLPFGPVCNWGVADEQAGFAPMPAAARRERILAIQRRAAEVLGVAARTTQD